MKPKFPISRYIYIYIYTYTYIHIYIYIYPVTEVCFEKTLVYSTRYNFRFPSSIIQSVCLPHQSTFDKNERKP